MELFLWLYFYDNRWLFNLKVPVNIYKYIWILPICVHSILISVAVYYLEIANNFTCAESMRIWLYHRTVFSFLLCLNIIVFMVKITQVYEKENSYFEKAQQIFPILNLRIHEYDYWIRRNSLFSTPGVLLLIQGIISFIWSLTTTGSYENHHHYECNAKIQQVFDFHSIFITYGNMLVLLMIALMVTIKVCFFLIGVFFLKMLIKITHLVCRNKSKLILYFDYRESVNKKRNGVGVIVQDSKLHHI